MNCLNPTCERQNEVLGDYPLCNDCAPSRHFEYRNDCRCPDCATKRVVAARAERRRLAEIAWEEEMSLYYCYWVQAAA